MSLLAREAPGLPRLRIQTSPVLENLFVMPSAAAGPRGLLRDLDGDGRRTVSDLFHVPDSNRNGSMDLDDLYALPDGTALIRPGEEKVDTPRIVRTILDENPAARIIAIGEVHEQSPILLVAEMVKELRRRGKKVSFALEMVAAPDVDYLSNGRRISMNSPLHAEFPRLIDRFNRGELPPETFLRRVRQDFSTNPFIRAVYDNAARGHLLQAIETAVRSGADRFHAVDVMVWAKPGANRDRDLADAVAALARRAGPDRMVTGLFGYGHIHERPLTNETRPLSVIDAAQPMGGRLDQMFGDAYVSVRSFGIADAARDEAKRSAAERLAFIHLAADSNQVAPEDLEEAIDYTAL
jgi:hypothetical protein